MSLSSIYVDASPEQLDRGRGWYDAFRGECEAISDLTATALERVVAAAAILSPNCQVQTNLDYTLRACQSGGDEAVGRYPNVMQERYAPILRGEREPLNVLTGPKVRA